MIRGTLRQGEKENAIHEKEINKKLIQAGERQVKALTEPKPKPRKIWEGQA